MWSVIDVLRQGTRRASLVAEETLGLAKRALQQELFPRTLQIL